MLICDEIHGNILSTPPTLLLPACPQCVFHTVMPARAVLGCVERVRLGIHLIRVGMVNFAGQSSNRS